MEWEYDGNQPKDGHPLVVGWKSNLKGWEKCVYTDEVPLWETEKATVRLLEIENGYQLDAGELEKRRRTRESQTSIDKLIQFPFDYVSEYLAGLWEVKDGELADLKTTEGLVAHRYIEKLFEEGREEMVAFYEKLSDEELRNMYFKQGMAVKAISEKTGLGPSGLYKRLEKMKKSIGDNAKEYARQIR